MHFCFGRAATMQTSHEEHLPGVAASLQYVIKLENVLENVWPKCLGLLNANPWATSIPFQLFHMVSVAVSLGLSFTNPAPTNARDKTSQLCACKVQVSSYQLELQDLLLLSSNKYMKFTLVQIIQAWQL